MTTEEQQAESLARWLEDPSKPPPPELDPEVVEAILCLKPELAPAPQVSVDEILASVTEGPLAAPPSALATEPEIAPENLPEPANTAARPAPWTRWAMGGGAAALLSAAIIVLVIVPALQPSADYAPPSTRSETGMELTPSRDEAEQRPLFAEDGDFDLEELSEAEPPAPRAPQDPAASVLPDSVPSKHTDDRLSATAKRDAPAPAQARPEPEPAPIAPAPRPQARSEANAPPAGSRAATASSSSPPLGGSGMVGSGSGRGSLDAVEAEIEEEAEAVSSPISRSRLGTRGQSRRERQAETTAAPPRERSRETLDSDAGAEAAAPSAEPAMDVDEPEITLEEPSGDDTPDPLTYLIRDARPRGPISTVATAPYEKFTQGDTAGALAASEGELRKAGLSALDQADLLWVKGQALASLGRRAEAEASLREALRLRNP